MNRYQRAQDRELCGLQEWRGKQKLVVAGILDLTLLTLDRSTPFHCICTQALSLPGHMVKTTVGAWPAPELYSLLFHRVC